MLSQSIHANAGVDMTLKKIDESRAKKYAIEWS